MTTKALQTTTERGAPLAIASQPNALIGLWRADMGRDVEAGLSAQLTADTYARGMARFTAWLESAGHLATRDTLREWMADERKRGAKPGSINAWLGGVRAFYAWAVAAGHMPDSPAEGVRGQKRAGSTKAHKRDALTNEEMRRLLRVAETLPNRDRAILLLFAYTGVRTIEVTRANVGDLHTKDGAQCLAVHGKGHTEADDDVVIAHPDALNALREWLAERGGASGPLFMSYSNKNARARGGRLSTRFIRGVVKKAYRAAGIVEARKTTHSLRHTVATNILRNGGTIQQVKATLRHANIATSSIYAHELDRVSDAGERLISYA